MQKNQKVKLVSGGGYSYTVGGIYPVIAGEGDADISITSDSTPIPEMNDFQFNIVDDDGDIRFCVFPQDVFNIWEIVE